jgi:ubiquitin C-terminal hydrolase
MEVDPTPTPPPPPPPPITTTTTTTLPPPPSTTTTPTPSTTVTKSSPSITLLEMIALEELIQKNSSRQAFLLATQRLNTLLAKPGKLSVDEITRSLRVQETLSGTLIACTLRDVVKLITVSESTTDCQPSTLATTSFKGSGTTETLKNLQPATIGMRNGKGETAAKGRGKALEVEVEVEVDSFLEHFIDPSDIDPAGGDSSFNLELKSNACYIATIVLTLLAMPSFVQHLCTMSDLNEFDKMPLHHALFQLFQRLLHTSEKKFNIDMTNIKSSLDRIHPESRYNGSTNQRDVSRTWLDFLYVLETEIGLNANSHLLLAPFKSNSLDTILTQVENYRNNYRMNIINHFFETIIVVSRTCDDCKTQTNSIEIYKLFALPLPTPVSSSSTQAISLLEIINKKLKTGITIDGKDCDTCGKKKTTCTERITIGSLPNVIIFSLQRAKLQKNVEQKLFTRVIPEEYLDLESLDSTDTTKFVLVGVSIHEGGDINGGHYVTLARFKGKYYYFDDNGSRRRATTLKEAFEDKIQQGYVNISQNSLLFYYAKVKDSSNMVDVDEA